MSRRSTSDLFLLFQFVVASTAFVRAIQPHQHCEAYSDGITQCGRSHPSYITRGSDSCTSNNQHLIATAIAGADTSGRPILVDIAVTVAATRSNGDGVRVSPRNRWSLPHGQNTPREGRIITKGAPGWGIMSACDNSNIIGSHRGAAAATPLWLRVRGGASTEVGESSDASVSSEGPTARAGDKKRAPADGRREVGLGLGCPLEEGNEAERGGTGVVCA